MPATLPFTMQTWIFFAVLGAALLHAVWNMIVKGGSNKLYEVGIKALGGGICAACALPFMPLPARDCLPLLAASCLCHLFYYLCISATYKIADLTLGYSIMRGAAPIFTATILALAGQHFGFYGWLGILSLCSGILLLGLQHFHKGNPKAIFFALRTALVITCYTLADGFGARSAGNSVSYTLWIFFLNIFPINIWILYRHGRDYIDYLKKRSRPGLFGGFCSLLSYGIVIWAMSRASIALVGALRETSVIFGAILAMLFLGEKLTTTRACAILLVTAGAIAVRLG